MSEKKPKKGKRTRTGRRQRRYSYLNDYQKNEKGEYEYKGDYYQFQGTEKTLHGNKVRLLVFSVASFVCSVAAGCIPAPGMSSLAVLILPYATGLAASGSVCLAVFSLCREKDPMRGHVYHKTVGRLPLRTGVMETCAVICLIAEVVAMIGFDHERIWYGLLFLILEAAMFAAGMMIRRDAGKNNWERIPAAEEESATGQEAEKM